MFELEKMIWRDGGLFPLVILAYSALMPSVEITPNDVDVRRFLLSMTMILNSLLGHAHDLFLLLKALSCK
ncbi:Uncharacterized protein TCM_013708 [Theobroma cacao]|uniref:Uncharacterized protein n=1 Tax=Theobroma cacao TaxID=3641 RepID=A0A061FWQ4_THECC|nr:Uncharacterized protein TCM_013708 [Theobroma cacao]